MIQQRSCEALLSVGRVREAGESVLRMMDQEVHMTESIKAWVSGELSFYMFFVTSKISGKTSCNDIFPRWKTMAM